MVTCPERSGHGTSSADRSRTEDLVTNEPQKIDDFTGIILVVDDEKLMREVICERLARETFQIVEAEDAETALAGLADHDFDLAIVDVKLPGMDGIELTIQIKKESPDTMIVMITGVADVDIAVRAMRAGAEDFALKPFNLDALILTVERALGKRRLILENRAYQEELEERVWKATAELEETHKELQLAHDQLQNIFDSSPDAIVSTNTKGRIDFFSRGAEEMLQCTQEEACGARAHHFLGDGMEDIRRMVVGLQARGRVLNYAADLVRKDETKVPVTMSVSLLHGTDGGVSGAISISKDMTEQRELERNLRELSIRDALTDVYNRRYFRERLSNELNRARRQGHNLSVLLFDVDDFKAYNDTHGHLAGDKMLEHLGAIAKECIREDVDVPFRYGGDEFTVVLVETTADQAREVADRLRSSFAKYTRGESTLSIGLLAHAEGMDEDTIIREVDRRMYRAKRAGGNQIAE